MTVFKEPFASLVREMGSPTKVAAAVGCTEATVIKWGTGKAKPNGDYQIQVVKLCLERGIEYDVKDGQKASDTAMQAKIIEIEDRLSKLEELILKFQNTEPLNKDIPNNNYDDLKSTLDITCKRVEILINFMERDIEINMMKEDEGISKILEDLNNA